MGNKADKSIAVCTVPEFSCAAHAAQPHCPDDTKSAKHKPHVSTAVTLSTATSSFNRTANQGKEITNIVKEATSACQTVVHVLSFNIGGCRVKLTAQLSNARPCVHLHKI